MDNSSNLLHYSAMIGTWLVVFCLSVLVMRDAGGHYIDLIPEAVTLQLLFLALLLLVTQDRVFRQQLALKRSLYLGALGVVLVLGWRTHISFLPIYSIIWITVAPYYFSERLSLAILLFVSLAWYFIMRISWQETDATISALLFATFHFFALLSSTATKKATLAKERSLELNRELTATQHLLTEATKQSERTRIARDLHDLLGHHLTALTINLQVASRLSQGRAKESVDQSHALSKLLLNDVRDAVTTLHEESAVNFGETLRLIVENVPNLKVHLDIDSELGLNDVNVAQTILRCVQEAITNTLKHSSAKESWIRVWREDQQLRLRIEDNGQAPVKLIPGHGLAGMRERIERLDGQLVIDTLEHLRIEVQVPLAGSRMYVR